MVASYGGHGLLYFMTDVSSLLHNYRIATLPERYIRRLQADEALGIQMHSWQDSAIAYPRSRLVDSVLPKAGVFTDRPIRFRPYVNESGHRPEPSRLLGWSISALVHAFILAVVVLSNLYLTPLRAAPQNDSFRWEVSLMAAPRVEAVVADGIESRETSAVEEVEEIDPAAIADARSLEQVEAYSSHRDESVLQEMAAPAVSSRQRRDQELVSEKSRRKTDDLKRAVVMPVMTAAETVQPPPEMERQRDSNRLQVETQPESPIVLQRPPVLTRELINRMVLPDYGWLMNTLRAKLERVKVYPASAKSSHVQGRVVVQVSIEGDGRIANPEIEESSGSPILDQAALDALRAASPLTLSHRLEAPSIVMLIPLNYQLE
jgi:periplasmic protein TonB